MTSISIFGDADEASRFLTTIDRRDRDYGFVWDDETINPDQLLRLTVSNARVISLAPMYNTRFRTLSQLNLSFNRITDISHLSHLNALQILDISHNRIVALDAIRKLTNLTILRCHNNSIEALEPLIGLGQLAELWLSDNKIDWLEYIYLLPLVNLNHLVKSNNLSDAKPKFDHFVLALCSSLVTLDGHECSLHPSIALGSNLSATHASPIEFLSTVDGRIMLAQCNSHLNPSVRAQLQRYVDRISVYSNNDSSSAHSDHRGPSEHHSSYHQNPTKNSRHAASPGRAYSHDDHSTTSHTSRHSYLHAHNGEYGKSASPIRPGKERVKRYKAQKKAFVTAQPLQTTPMSIHSNDSATFDRPMIPLDLQHYSSPHALSSPRSGANGTAALSVYSSLGQEVATDTSRASPRADAAPLMQQQAGFSPTPTHNMATARKLFNKIDKNSQGSISLSELIFIARDNQSEEGRMLHELLQLPMAVHQEDGSKDAIVRLFADMHGPAGGRGEHSAGVSFDEWLAFMQSHHFLNSLGELRAEAGQGSGQARSRKGHAAPTPRLAIGAGSPRPAPLSSPSKQQIVRFGTDDLAPVALCLQEDGSGYARWGKNGAVACSFEGGRIFSSYRGGAIAVVLDKEGNGSVMDTKGKCVLLISAGGTARVMDKTGRVLSEERKDQNSLVPCYKWSFDGLTIEFNPRVWEVRVKFQNDKMVCEFSSLTGGRLLRDKTQARAVRGAGAEGEGFESRVVSQKQRIPDLAEAADHAALRSNLLSITSGLDSMLDGLHLGGNSGGKQARAFERQSRGQRKMLIGRA